MSFADPTPLRVPCSALLYPSVLAGGRCIPPAGMEADRSAGLVSQRPVLRGRDRNRDIPNKDVSPAQDELLRSRDAIAVRIGWRRWPSRGGFLCDRNPASTFGRAHGRVDNMQEQTT